MKIKRGQILVMIGDSITDAGRFDPPANGNPDAMGRGYVTQVDALIAATYPERAIKVINVGVSGNTVRNLKERWERDVTGNKPDWLSVMIGTNDVWRQFDRPDMAGGQVLEPEYEQTYRELLTITKPSLKGLVLMTPYYIQPDLTDKMRARMDEYGQIVKQLAKEFDAIFVDTQAMFNDVVTRVDASKLSADRIHPNKAGHMMLAKAFLKAVGFKW